MQTFRALCLPRGNVIDVSRRTPLWWPARIYVARNLCGFNVLNAGTSQLDQICLRSARSTTVLVLLVLLVMLICLVYPLALAEQRYDLSDQKSFLGMFIGGFIILALCLFFMMARYVSQLIKPDTLTISIHGVEFASRREKFSVDWRKTKPVQKVTKFTPKGGRSYYARLDSTDDNTGKEIFLGAFSFDGDDVFRCLVAAQSGRLIDLGDPPRQNATLFGWIPLFSMTALYIAWRVGVAILSFS